MRPRFRSIAKWLVMTICVAAAGIAVVFHSHWLPAARRVAGTRAGTQPADFGHTDQDHDHAEGDQIDEDHAEEDHAEEDHAEEDHAENDLAGHDHGEPAYDHEHDEAATLRLSEQAKANIGRDLRRVELRPFARTISVPATVVRRPGRSQTLITATFTGLVTQIYCIEGQAVTPGMPLFDLQLTHEELVDAQADFLRIAEELDVVRLEVDRLAKVAAEGAVAGKTLLQAQYEHQKLEASLRAQRQRLLLHRLSSEQVDGILDDHRLLQQLTVAVPLPGENTNGNGQRLMQMQELKVEKGQHVAAGDPLCTLADHAKLYVEGKAFEQDIPTLAAAAKNHWALTAVFQSADNRRFAVPNLEILYLGNEVDQQSRAFSFYVTLPNELVRDTKNAAGQRFIDWKFKPGQRLRLLVPTEPTTRRIVLPVEAVVRDGVESYVFEHNQDHFDRRSVHVEYRDRDRVVIAKDGGLKLGVQIAVSGAYQIHLATKNKDGQAMDPHAGHHH